ncbi:MAG: YqaJ viral recombinase family protein [Proteobacteria bacterium]|nr:YqaJ viral recombinase family protein [Pseudomonadota bacterium]
MTNEQRVAWLEGRRRGIGGSDVAAVLSLNPWKTPLDVWNDKLGLSEDKGMSEPAYWGTVLEDTVAREFQQRTGMKVQKVSHQFVDPECGWMIANIDRAIINREIAKKVRPLLDVEEIERYANITGVERPINTDVAFEAKTAHAFTADLWGPSQELEIKQNNIKTEHVIPLYYETQIQWYCGILKLRGMYLAVLIGGSDFRMYWIDARPDVFQVIKEKCAAFWNNHVLTKTPPEPINIDDVLKLYGKSNGKALEAQGELAIDYGEYARIAGEIKELQKQQDALKTKLAIGMKDNEILTLDGKKVLTYKTQSRKFFDTNSFKEDHLDDFYDYLKESSTRIMRVCA